MASISFVGTSGSDHQIHFGFDSNKEKKVLWFDIVDYAPGSQVRLISTNNPNDVYFGQYDSVTGYWMVDLTSGPAFDAGYLPFTISVIGQDPVDSANLFFRVHVLPPITTVPIIETFTDNVGLLPDGQGEFPSGTQTDDRTITLNGKVDSEYLNNPEKSFYKLVIYQNGVRLGTANVDANGNWSYVVDDVLEHHTKYNYEARFEDDGGNVGDYSSKFVVDVELSISIDSLTTADFTPLLTGHIGFELLQDEYVTISVNGKTYSSSNGQVVVDQEKMTWSLQIPDSDALKAGTYEVVAALHKSTGEIIVQDNTANELRILDPVIPPVVEGNDDEKATAMTLSENGQWKIYTNGTVLDQKATDEKTFGTFDQTHLKGKDVYGPINKPTAGTQNGTWLDINRDGYMDFVSNDGNAETGQQMYYNIGNNTYLSYQIGSQYRNGPDYNPKANVMAQYAGVIGFDKNGDGFADIAYGNIAPGRSGFVTAPGSGYTSNRTWDSQIVSNINGNVQSMVKDKNFTDSRLGPSNFDYSPNAYNAQPGPEISGVDLNNDGIVDLVYHGVSGYSKLGNERPDVRRMSNDQQRLVVVSSDGKDGYSTSQIIEGVFQNTGKANSTTSNAISMTWADFNGDGFMDLFIGRGKAQDGHSEYESRILYNDGNGNLGSTAPNAIGTANNIHWLGDNLEGGPSIAVDWNGDGKMDIIELPAYSAGNGVSANGTTGTVNLYTNNSTSSGNSFSTSNLLGGTNTIGVNGTVNAHKSPGKNDPVTGAVVADINWDGAQDLLIFTQQGNTEIVRNQTTIAKGTALHFRILDQEGINSFLGNTVQLYDSKGNLVASQIINPQSGNQTSDTSGIVNFYGLDPNETYSLKLLRNVKGVSSNIDSTVNEAWGGFVAGEAYEAHVLTAESGDSSKNANLGTGIVGTGYNDTFYATKGTDKYDGAGGWSIVNGHKEWSDTGGLDIIDFKLAGNTAVNVDLSKTTYQNTGFNTVLLKNIEGVAGGNGNDTFTGNSQDNYFNGRGGDDTFNLHNSGHHTLIYERIDVNDATGGNGHDIANGFTIGDFNTNANADRIDLSGLLIGYQDGVSNIADYISVVHQGNNTIISVDIDGTNSQFSSSAILTLNNVLTDLDTLVNNHQIVV
ncbi:type I secretion C-terminal target domain-containing protein [Bartonella sp. HY038]|uniref:type I secretion C-terminal target domain-containing protein n=1 Tax=Bartonella sp. HY038 TaxID=2759660 RepID=UPI0015FE41E8|nr:type I secretion C-terminal target domain-containing protein [Bartonella sp. HY038]